jgi:glutathione synthase/RimK-type ligase-like ATP-grasp enzyme
LELTFGAVDILRDINRVSYVLEVNTAPGLEGTTLTNYERAIRSALGTQESQWNSITQRVL